MQIVKCVNVQKTKLIGIYYTHMYLIIAHSPEISINVSTNCTKNSQCLTK